MDEENLESIMKRWSDLCLRQPCSFQDHPFGPDSTVFKVAGKDKSTAKMFALLMVLNDEVVLNLKCEPALADQQRAEFTQITPGYHMSKKHWNSVRAGPSMAWGWSPVGAYSDTNSKWSIESLLHESSILFEFISIFFNKFGHSHNFRIFDFDNSQIFISCY